MLIQISCRQQVYKVRSVFLLMFYKYLHKNKRRGRREVQGKGNSYELCLFFHDLDPNIYLYSKCNNKDNI